MMDSAKHNLPREVRAIEKARATALLYEYAAKNDVPVSALIEPYGGKDISRKRQEFCYLAYDKTLLGEKLIGTVIKRNYKTVKYNIEAHQKRMESTNGA